MTVRAFVQAKHRPAASHVQVILIGFILGLAEVVIFGLALYHYITLKLATLHSVHTSTKLH